MIDHCAGRIAVQALFRINHHVPETTSAIRDWQYRTHSALAAWRYKGTLYTGRARTPAAPQNKTLTSSKSEASLREREPTVAREHINGDDVISTPRVNGAREGARVEIMSGAPVMCGSGELSGSPRNPEFDSGT